MTQLSVTEFVQLIEELGQIITQFTHRIKNSDIISRTAQVKEIDKLNKENNITLEKMQKIVDVFQKIGMPQKDCTLIERLQKNSETYSKSDQKIIDKSLQKLIKNIKSSYRALALNTRVIQYRLSWLHNLFSTLIPSEENMHTYDKAGKIC